MRKHKIMLLCFFIFLFIYLEFIYHIFVFNNITFNFLYVLFFSISFGTLFYLLSSLFNKLANNIISYVLTIALIVLFISNFIYYKVYISVISIYSMIHGGQVFGFMERIIAVATRYWYVMLLMILPIFILITLNVISREYFNKISWKSKGILALCLIFSYLTSIIGINLIDTKKIYSNKNLYYNMHSPLLTVERLGLTTMYKLDLQRTIFGFTEKTLLPEKKKTNESEIIII